jgi:hypothetical protein
LEAIFWPAPFRPALPLPDVLVFAAGLDAGRDDFTLRRSAADFLALGFFAFGD